MLFKSELRPFQLTAVRHYLTLDLGQSHRILQYNVFLCIVVWETSDVTCQIIQLHIEQECI